MTNFEIVVQNCRVDQKLLANRFAEAASFVESANRTFQTMLEADQRIFGLIRQAEMLRQAAAIRQMEAIDQATIRQAAMFRQLETIRSLERLSEAIPEITKSTKPTWSVDYLPPRFSTHPDISRSRNDGSVKWKSELYGERIRSCEKNLIDGNIIETMNLERHTEPICEVLITRLP